MSAAPKAASEERFTPDTALGNERHFRLACCSMCASAEATCEAHAHARDAAQLACDEAQHAVRHLGTRAVERRESAYVGRSPQGFEGVLL